MKIDPYAWLLTVPLTIALVQVWFLPAEHAVKRCLRTIQEAEADVWMRLNRGLWRPEPGELCGASWLRGRVLHHAMVAVFALTSMLSFAAFVGIWPQ